jgi:hypothetical protein
MTNEEIAQEISKVIVDSVVEAGLEAKIKRLLPYLKSVNVDRVRPRLLEITVQPKQSVDVITVELKLTKQ